MFKIGDFLLKSMEAETVTKQILEQLRNKEYRKMAWKIYRGANHKSDDESESETIQNLDKHIEGINSYKNELESKHRRMSTTSNIIKSSGKGVIRKKNMVSWEKDNDRETTTKYFKNWSKNFKSNIQPKIKQSEESIKKKFRSHSDSEMKFNGIETEFKKVENYNNDKRKLSLVNENDEEIDSKSNEIHFELSNEDIGNYESIQIDGNLNKAFHEETTKF